MSSFTKKPAVPSSRPQRNPSHSRTHLTALNYHGPSLHSIKSRSDTSHGFDVVLESTTATSAPTMNEDEINALPESGDDEDVENVEPLVNVIAELRTAPPKRKSPVQKELRPSKRSKLRDEPDVIDLQLEPASKLEKYNTSQHAELDMASSSASQKIRKKYTRPPPPNRPASAPLKAPPTASEAKRGQEQPSKTFRVHEAPLEQTEIPKKKVLKIYAPQGSTLPSTPESSAVSQATSLSEQMHDLDELTTSPRSSPGTTPHSAKGQDVEINRSNICPYCDKKVVRSRLANPTINLIDLQYLQLRRQQDFCHEHSLADAKVFYTKQRYPAMKWPGLKKRISMQIPKLKQILQREKASYFLQQIDTRIADRKNRKQIRHFLEEQAKDIDSLPPGYYGPKGTSIMAEAIATELSHCFSGRDTDGTLKALGVGPYVAFVLVPECTTFLVMKDMGVSQDAARLIMRESSQAGMLMHPEDEFVIRQDDEN